jgi:Flp pilus assembly pilin Flp
MAKINTNIVKTNNVNSLVRDEEGLSTVEYVIILFLIAIIGIVAWRNFGSSVKGKVENATTEVQGL